MLRQRVKKPHKDISRVLLNAGDVSNNSILLYLYRYIYRYIAYGNIHNNHLKGKI